MVGLTTVVVLAPAALVAFLVALLFTRVRKEDCTAEWLNEFSLDTYLPMQRLLNERDYCFLASQAGYHDGIARKLRNERKAIFRTYLRELNADFHRLLHIAQLVIVHSETDRSDLVRTVSKLRRQFYLAMIVTHVQLALDPLPLGSINVSTLLNAPLALQGSLAEGYNSGSGVTY